MRQAVRPANDLLRRTIAPLFAVCLAISATAGDKKGALSPDKEVMYFLSSCMIVSSDSICGSLNAEAVPAFCCLNKLS